MTRLKLHLKIRFERSLTMSSESLPPDRESVQSFDLHDDGYTLATFVYYSRDELLSVDFGDGRGPRPPAPLFHWQHDPDKRLFKLTLTEDGKREYWRDNPTRFLVVEPDPTTGTVKPVLKRGRPVYLWLCREEREAR